MSWLKKRDPALPAEPAYHNPKRCMHCGHLEEQHAGTVGCLVPGGTKYLHDPETGKELRACSCEAFIPVPPDLEEAA